MTSRFDWPGTMRVGLGLLGLAPEAFWAMTPREFEAAVQGRFGRSGTIPRMNVAQLEQLMRQFPDT